MFPRIFQPMSFPLQTVRYSLKPICSTRVSVRLSMWVFPKIDQAQYRELEAFSKFSSDMDPVTAMAIDRGRKNNQLLIQPQYSPMPVGEQIAILYCGTHSLLRDVPLHKVQDFQKSFLEMMRADHQKDVLDVLSSGVINDDVTAIIEKVAADTAQPFKVNE